MRNRLIITVGLAAIGLVWIGQGLGFLTGSGFMVDDRRWAVVGGVILVGAVLLGWRTIKGRPRA